MATPKLTKAKRKMIENKLRHGVGVGFISQQFHSCMHTIRRIRDQIGVSPLPSGQVRDPKVERRIVELLDTKIPFCQIAREVGRSEAVVRRVRDKYATKEQILLRRRKYGVAASV